MRTRRTFIAGLGATAAWPLAARGQQKQPVIGWLHSASVEGYASRLAAFKRGLEDGGYVEGRNVAIEYRWAENHDDRLPELAADLVHRKVSAIFAGGASSALPVKALTTTIPIVFVTGADPVATGLVASLAHPGGNLTGAASLTFELNPKKLELLHEVLSGTSTIAALISESDFGESQARDLQQAAGSLGLQLHILRASTDAEIESAFDALPRLRAGGLVITSSLFFIDRSERLAALSLRHAMPTISLVRDFAAAGGLMSYGAVSEDAFRLAGIYTARILNGERPANLPVQRSTAVELIINMKTARTLGITVPLSLLGRADEVIE